MKFEELEQYNNAWLNTLTHEDIAKNSFPVIIDRDQSDVDMVNSLNKKGAENWSVAERETYFGIMKGAYTYNDTNRVEYAAKYLSDLLNKYGYKTVYTQLTIDRTDGRDSHTWYADDYPIWSRMVRYFNNIRNIRSAISVYDTTPNLPFIVKNLTPELANSIERILYDVDILIKNMIAAAFYCGEVFSGEV